MYPVIPFAPHSFYFPEQTCHAPPYPGEIVKNISRGHTGAFCLADSGQRKDAFASRKRHVIEEDTTVWLVRHHFGWLLLTTPLSPW